MATNMNPESQRKRAWDTHKFWELVHDQFEASAYKQERVAKKIEDFIDDANLNAVWEFAEKVRPTLVESPDNRLGEGYNECAEEVIENIDAALAELEGKKG